VENLVQVLKSLLCDTYAFYYRAHQAHWNVVGRDFSQYHDLFGAIYDDAYGSIDRLAENLRKLDAFAPVSLREVVDGCGLAQGPVAFDPDSLARDLLASNDALIAKLRVAFIAADSANEQGIANFIAEREDAHKKWRWQLKASSSATIDPAQLAELD